MAVVQKVVLVPRFTAFRASQQYRTAPVHVSDFAEAVITAWRGEFVDGMPGSALSIWLEESVDQVTWRTVDGGPLVPNAGEEVTQTYQFQAPWIRVVIGPTLGVALAMVTCWVGGNFTRRDR